MPVAGAGIRRRTDLDDKIRLKVERKFVINAEDTVLFIVYKMRGTSGLKVVGWRDAGKEGKSASKNNMPI
jgi:hypothetical protein